MKQNETSFVAAQEYVEKYRREEKVWKKIGSRSGAGLFGLPCLSMHSFMLPSCWLFCGAKLEEFGIETEKPMRYMDWALVKDTNSNCQNRDLL